MCKKSTFRGPLNKQHGRAARELVKSASKHLFHIHWSLPVQLSWKKSLPYWRKKSWYCLLTHWLAMESIVLLIETIQRYQFWCKYLRNKKIFSECLTAFLKSRFNFKHFEKKMNLIPFVFRKVRTPKTLLDKCWKGPVSEDPSTSKLADVPKDCWHLYHSILSYSYITANSIELEKFSLIDMQNLGTAC